MWQKSILLLEKASGYDGQSNLHLEGQNPMNKFMLCVYRGGNILLATQKNLAKRKRIGQKEKSNGNRKKKS